MTLTFPRHVHRRGGIYREVESHEAYLLALAQGWEDRPLAAWPVPDEYRPFDPQRDGETPVSAPALAPVPRRGRPPRQTPKASEGRS